MVIYKKSVANNSTNKTLPQVKNLAALVKKEKNKFMERKTINKMESSKKEIWKEDNRKCTHLMEMKKTSLLIKKKPLEETMLWTKFAEIVF